MAEPKRSKVDPFKTKKTKTVATKVNDTVTPPDDVQKAVDAFREAQEQAKHFEGEATVAKDKIQDFCHLEFAKRLLGGVDSSFKVMGEETMVTYIVADSSAGLTDEDLASFAERWGDEAAEELITRDYMSIRFDPKVLEANYDAVVEALQVLPPDVLENLFKPMLMKARQGAAEKARKFAKTPEAMKEILSQLRMKNYIK